MSANRMVQLDELMASRLGSVDPSKFSDETFELYSVPAYDSRKPVVVTGKEIGSTKQIVQPRDVLLSKIVPHIRRSWIVGPAGDHRQIASGEWIVFRGDQAAPEYLRHVLLGDVFHAQFMQTVSGVGGSLLRARPAQVAKIRIPLPSLSEQRRIAAILDKADALRTKRRNALAQLDLLAQSIFVEMFGDPATNPKGWPVAAIGNLLESASYGTSEKSATTGRYPVLRMNNITRTGETDFTDLKYMDLDESEHERYLVKAGDVLFNRTNSADLVGKTAIFRETEPMAYAGYLVRLRTNRDNDSEYLAGFMNTPYAKRVLRGMCKSIIGMANINATEVQGIRIAQPPLALQVQFRERIAALNQVKARHRTALAELDKLFLSLQYRAFQGEL